MRTLEDDAVATLERDGIERARIRLTREADVRYAGQSMEVRVPAPAGQIDAAFVAGIIDAFHAAHLKAFGYNYAGQQKVEIVNFCVSGFGMIDRPNIPKLAGGTNVTPRHGSRPVYFGGASARRRSTIALLCRPAFASTAPPSSRNLARRPLSFRDKGSLSTRTASLIVRRNRVADEASR